MRILARYSAIFSVLLGYWSFKLKTWGHCTGKLRRHITMYFGEFVSIDPFSGDWKFFFWYSHYQTPPMNFFLYSSGLIYMDSAKCSHWLTYWFCQQSSKIHCLKIHSFLLLFVMYILHVGLRFCFLPTPQLYPYQLQTSILSRCATLCDLTSITSRFFVHTAVIIILLPSVGVNYD